MRRVIILHSGRRRRRRRVCVGHVGLRRVTYGKKPRVENRSWPRDTVAKNGEYCEGPNVPCGKELSEQLMTEDTRAGSGCNYPALFVC